MILKDCKSLIDIEGNGRKRGAAVKITAAEELL